MKNNTLLAFTSGICFLAFTVQAQQYSEKETTLAYSTQKASKIIYKSTAVTTGVTEGVEVVDYPTVSYPETVGFSVEKEKAIYHLSWQVMMRDNLLYTEVQSSSDGVNFTTVGYVINDNSAKNQSFDYFVPSDKNNASTFRLVQCGLNAQKHSSEIVSVR